MEEIIYSHKIYNHWQTKDWIFNDRRFTPDSDEADRELEKLIKQGELKHAPNSMGFYGSEIIAYKKRREVSRKQVEQIEELLKQVIKKLDILTAEVKKLQVEKHVPVTTYDGGEVLEKKV